MITWVTQSTNEMEEENGGGSPGMILLARLENDTHHKTVTCPHVTAEQAGKCWLTPRPKGMQN